ncbi:unnamed protein product [Moneuplotes crassus]|uniref:non-specific serine/threonine protein kinase n=3 Tax=Euplotes crassus TaxID=5936 RepID=A0AAD1XB50_EUPCR|nr:unnamed protein product [Moneuplotes crassus]
MEENPKKIYIDDFMSDEEESSSSPTKKKLDRQQYEENKSKFDLKKLISEFILKKEYFISHKTTSIFDDYDFEDKPAGKGSFGVVFKAHEKHTGLIRAIKQVMNENIKNYDGFMGEVAALKTLDHPNIIKLYEVYEDKDCVYLVQEFCEGGELFYHIVENDHLEEKEAARVFLQITSSILYCHKNCICHRDLKPDNFMLASKDSESLVKLIDFGLSRSFYKLKDEGGEMLRMETRAGTALYMAPEVLDKDYSNACDTWSLGVILYIMISGLLPFEGSTDAEIEENIRNINYDFDDDVWKEASDEVKDLISKMLVYEKDRITPKEALKHPWLAKFTEQSHETDKMSYVEKLEDFKDSNNLKKAILSFLATKVNDEEIKDEIELFNSFDTNNDGYITKKELKKGLYKLGKRTDEEVDQIMDSMDTDKNGAINFNEFISATLNSGISKDYERIVKAFEFFDLDNDGLIDENELKNALAGQEFAKIDVGIFQEAIKQCDLDNDGKISFDEFGKIMSLQLDKMAKDNMRDTLTLSTGV